MVVKLSSLEEQKNSDNSNISSIDFGDFEKKLRIAYNISEDVSLIIYSIYKVDIKSEDLSKIMSYIKYMIQL